MLTFYVDDFHTVALGNSGLAFTNTSFGTTPVGEYQNKTYVTNTAGTSVNLEVNNTKWTHPNSGSVNGGVSQSLLAIPNYLSTVNIRFTNTEYVKVRNWKLRATHRDSIITNPDLTVQAAEIIHPNSDFGVTGSGDSAWVSIFGSGSVLDITSSPGTSGLFIYGTNTSDIRHDAYVVISCQASDGGNKLFKLYSELEYLDSRGTQISNSHYVVEGDSISAAGGIAGEPISYARLMTSGTNIYVPTPTLAVFGVGGTNMSQMEARLPLVLPEIVAAVGSGKFTVTSTHMGNGLIELSPANLWLRHREYWNTLRASGSKVIEITVLPRSGVFAPGWDTTTDRIDFNNLVKADRSLYDELFDVDSKFYGQQNYAQNTIYYSDGVHPTDFLYAIMRQDIGVNFDNLFSADRPINTLRPYVTGVFHYGQTVTCYNGHWNYIDSFGYQWFRGSGLPNPISGATSFQYALQPLDVSTKLKCNVQGINNGISVYIASLYSPQVTSYYDNELITNTQLGSNIATGYTAAGGATFLAVSGRLVMTGHGNTNARVSQTLTTVSGEWYEFRNDFFFGTNSQAGRTICQNGVGGATVFVIDYTASGTYSTIFQASGTSTYIDWRDPSTATSGTTWMWDKITCRRITTNVYDAFNAEDYSKTTYSVSHASTTASGGPGNGPAGLSTEYSIFIPVDGYHYKGMDWGIFPFNSDSGDRLQCRVWISGAAGQVIGYRAQSQLNENSVVHTCNDTWQLLELTHPISGNLTGNVLGFENRSAVIPTVGAASATFRLWGLSHYMG